MRYETNSASLTSHWPNQHPASRDNPRERGWESHGASRPISATSFQWECSLCRPKSLGFVKSGLGKINLDLVGLLLCAQLKTNREGFETLRKMYLVNFTFNWAYISIPLWFFFFLNLCVINNKVSMMQAWTFLTPKAPTTQVICWQNSSAPSSSMFLGVLSFSCDPTILRYVIECLTWPSGPNSHRVT